jgi:hypothetical protein
MAMPSSITMPGQWDIADIWDICPGAGWDGQGQPPIGVSRLSRPKPQPILRFFVPPLLAVLSHKICGEQKPTERQDMKKIKQTNSHITGASKRTCKQCRAPAVRGWTVCRFHGAGGGAPKGAANGRYKHGLFTADTISERRQISAILRASRKTLAAFRQ